MLAIQIAAVILGMVLLALTIDLLRFTVARHRADKDVAGVKTDADGVLFIEGRRTYYRMPNGVRRKMADYPMDLTPGSPDMVQFTAALDQARKLHEAEKRASRKNALTNMRAVAKEEAEGSGK
jgi:hypothetical protein